jgi:biopolymer transport protein TolR
MGAPVVASRAARGRRVRHKPMSDINVTPFVDVMLVLLIVFMVTAPLLSAGVPVDLPQTSAAPLPVEKEPVTITVATDGKVFVKDQAVVLADLVTRLQAVTASASDRIYVRGDKAASYGAIMQVMSTISGAGFDHIALVALTDRSG